MVHHAKNVNSAKAAQVRGQLHTLKQQAFRHRGGQRGFDVAEVIAQLPSAENFQVYRSHSRTAPALHSYILGSLPALFGCSLVAVIRFADACSRYDRTVCPNVSPTILVISELSSLVDFRVPDRYSSNE
jgi:hypothetical protein